MVKPKATKKASSKTSKKSVSKTSKKSSKSTAKSTRMSTEDLSTKTVVQLKALAKKKEVNLDGITKKADIIAALEAAMKGQSPKKSPKKKAKTSPLEDHSKLLAEIKDANETRNETLYLFWETFREYIVPDMGEMSTSAEIVDYLFGKKIRVGGRDYQLDHPVIDKELHSSILLLLNEAPN